MQSVPTFPLFSFSPSSFFFRSRVLVPKKLRGLISKKSAECNDSPIYPVLIPLLFSMQRSPDHVLQFVLAELGTEGSPGGDGQLTLKGKFGPKHIESLLRKYISMSSEYTLLYYLYLCVVFCIIIVHFCLCSGVRHMLHVQICKHHTEA